MSAEAWRRVLLAEDAAAYAYTIIAVNSGGEWRQAALDARYLHLRARDVAAGRVTSSGGDPSTPSVYDLPFRVKNQRTAKRLARTVELRLVDVYLAQVPDASGADRRHLIESAQAATVRAMGWGWTPTAFPAAPARS